MSDSQVPYRKSVSTVLEQWFTETALREHRVPGLDTGIAGLDGILRGMQPGLAVLGGVTSVGKSTLAIGIGDYVSRHGTPVLYYSTEMPETRVTARIITRHHFALCAQTGQPCRFTAADLFDARHTARWDSDTYAAYNEALRAASGELREVTVDGVRQPYGLAPEGRIQPFNIIDGTGEVGALSAQFIREDATLFRDETGRTPFVIVDYLQMLSRGASRSMSERQEVDESIRHLIQLANSGFCVLVVSSLSRASYNKPIQEDAFKESGGIEFSASVLMGLQYAAVHEKNWAPEVEKRRMPRQIELVVLKNRYGMDGTVPLRYYARYDAFLEVDAPIATPEPPPQTPPKPVAPRPAAKAAPEPAERPEPADTPPEVWTEEPAPAPKAAVPRREGVAYGDYNSTKVAQLLRKGAVKPGVPERYEPIAGAQLSFTISAPLTSFDIDVADALYTLHSRRDRRFTVRALCAVLTGDEGIDIPAAGEPRGLKADVLESLERLTRSRIDIRCADELEGRGLSPRDFAGPMLTAEVLKPRWEYRMPEPLEDALPLYAYAQTVKQLRFFDLSLLHAVSAGGRKRSDTRDNVQIKRFLVRKALRVRYLKAGDRQPGNLAAISLSEGGELMTLLNTGERTGSEARRKQRLRRVREDLFWLLDHYSGALFDGYTVGPKGDSVRIE